VATTGLGKSFPGKGFRNLGERLTAGAPPCGGACRRCLGPGRGHRCGLAAYPEGSGAGGRNPWKHTCAIAPPTYLAWSLPVWTAGCALIFEPAPWVLAWAASVLLLIGIRRAPR